MSVATQPPLTLDEFLAMPETEPASEFWDGRARQKPMPMTKQSIIQGELTERLNAAAKSTQPRTGRALPELGCTFAGRSIVPDIAYVRRERLPVDPDGRVADRFLAPPDLVIEIVSPEQSEFELVEKLAWCVRNGVQMAWLIDPEGEEIMIFSPDEIPRLLRRDGHWDGGRVLPGFQCPAHEVFGWLRGQD